mgnify:CR=1 FL=1
MNFGTPSSYQENPAPLLDLALDAGINFIDTAEMYPSPASSETYGISEEILGKWLKSKTRHDVVLATKASGPGEFVPWIRDGKSNHDIKNLFGKNFDDYCQEAQALREGVAGAWQGYSPLQKTPPPPNPQS